MPMKKIYAKIATVLVLAVSLLTSCDIGNEADPLVLADVEKEFTLGMSEKFASDRRELQFLLATIRNQSCRNYQIEFDWTRVGTSLTLSVEKIVAPEICQTGTAPARSTVDAGQLPDGVYGFKVNLGNAVSSAGKLTVNSSLYSIKMDAENGFKLQPAELLRIPNGVIWGLVAYTNNFRNAAEQFTQELFKVSSSSNLRTGYYGQFTVANNGIVLEQSPDQPHITFVRQFSDDPAKLEALVAQFRQQYGTSISIQLYNTSGKVF